MRKTNDSCFIELSAVSKEILADLEQNSKASAYLLNARLWLYDRINYRQFQINYEFIKNIY